MSAEPRQDVDTSLRLSSTRRRVSVIDLTADASDSEPEASESNSDEPYSNELLPLPSCVETIPFKMPSNVPEKRIRKHIPSILLSSLHKDFVRGRSQEEFDDMGYFLRACSHRTRIDFYARTLHIYTCLGFKHTVTKGLVVKKFELEVEHLVNGLQSFPTQKELDWPPRKEYMRGANDLLDNWGRILWGPSGREHLMEQ